MSTRSIWILIASALGIGIAFAAYVAPASARFAPTPVPHQAFNHVESFPAGDPCSPAVTPTLPLHLFLPLIAKSAAVNPPPVPNFSHIYMIVMENKQYTDVVGSANAPYFNCLANAFGLASNYKNITHPSQPNYLAFFSGSTQSVTTNVAVNLTGQNVADQLEAKGKTWKVFAQNYPLNCFTGASATGGEDGAGGQYARKYNPAISFTDISGSPSRCANITDFTHFDPAAADYELIIPNLCNNTQSCPVATGDAFLQGFVPRILNSSAWEQGGVIFIIYDETDTFAESAPVPATVIANFGARGKTSAIVHDHYSLLRTIEDAWGLGCLNNACSANNLAEFFQ